MINKFGAIIIGGGPAGLAAAAAVARSGETALIIEREARLGGILKQCIHDGFGVIRFGEKLSGPEYAERYEDMVKEFKTVEVKLLTFVIKIEQREGNFVVTTTGRDGISTFEGKNLVFACGCRERTARQVGIHGTRPSGVMTAGVAQNFVNLKGVLPTKKCVILGSGDIGLIMARRLTLEGAEVLGVYEAKSTPSGLTRNISQCLNDFNIPLYLSTTVTRVFGNERVEAVEIAEVDDKMRPIKGTEKRVECDAVILSVGLIPENELAESIAIKIDRATRGPIVDQNMQTSKEGVYCVGNALHVHDLVDYVSETAEIAGKNIGRERNVRELIKMEQEGLGYLVPQFLDVNSLEEKTILYFRSARVLGPCVLKITADGEEIFKKRYPFGVRPPEMERITPALTLKSGVKVKVCLEEEKND